MQSLDNEFFEEYKRLDRLCSDMFSSRIGVSAYIEAMEAKAAQGQFLPFRCRKQQDLTYLS